MHISEIKKPQCQMHLLAAKQLLCPLNCPLHNKEMCSLPVIRPLSRFTATAANHLRWRCSLRAYFVPDRLWWHH